MKHFAAGVLEARLIKLNVTGFMTTVMRFANIDSSITTGGSLPTTANDIAYIVSNDICYTPRKFILIINTTHFNSFTKSVFYELQYS